MNSPRYSKLDRMIAESEIDPLNNSYELDAGEVVYFDRFLNEWVPVLEVR